MFFPYVLFSFMYFPEDKSEYIPAVISLAIVSILAYLAVRFVIKVSKREEKKAKELEEQLKRTIHERNS
jgi:large-conductance mechanosensitive channel